MNYIEPKTHEYSSTRCAKRKP